MTNARDAQRFSIRTTATLQYPRTDTNYSFTVTFTDPSKNASYVNDEVANIHASREHLVR